MPIVHRISFSVLHKSCGCYGNGNSQNVAPVGDLCVAGITCACLSCFVTQLQILSYLDM